MPKKKKVAPECLAATHSITNAFDIFPQSEPADDEAEPLPPERVLKPQLAEKQQHLRVQKQPSSVGQRNDRQSGAGNDEGGTGVPVKSHPKKPAVTRTKWEKVQLPKTNLMDIVHPHTHTPIIMPTLIVVPAPTADPIHLLADIHVHILVIVRVRVRAIVHVHVLTIAHIPAITRVLATIHILVITPTPILSLHHATPATNKPSKSYRSRPGPSSLTRPKVARKSPETTDEEQSEEETSGQVHSDEITYWRHLGKLFAMRYESWFSRHALRVACRCKSRDDAPSELLGILVDLLNEYNIKSDVRITKRFQSEFLHGMRQLRSELVHTMSEHALEILGIDGQQSDYREGRINKMTHPGFVHLRENNAFLGTGNTYLCSDQIVRGLRLALAGPGSIEAVKWKSRSRANQFNLSAVPTGLFYLVMTILYFLVMPRSDFDGFLKGKMALYINFWDSRSQDVEEFSPSQRAALAKHLNEQVFGVGSDDDDAEYERQKAFNEAKWGELKARAAKEEHDGGQSEGDETSDVGNEGKNIGKEGGDNGEGSSHGK